MKLKTKSSYLGYLDIRATSGKTEVTKTAVKISDEVLKKTTKCTKDFSCLNKEGEDLCKVESCIENKIHFIKCINDELCQYRMTFGYSFVCTCPTRKELYNLYRI